MAESSPLWLILLGAFADAVIGLGFFIPGELAFIAGGYYLAKWHYWPIVPLLWLAAIAGDLLSHELGRYCQRWIVPRLIAPKSLRRQQWRRCQQRLAKRPFLWLFSARFLGPLSWIAPFCSGALKLPRSIAYPASALGATLASSQFILLGWLSQKGLEQFELLLWLKALVS